MNYTPNCRLPQWEKSDPIRMEDFNDAMANMEAAVTSAQRQAGSADTKAEAAQNAALTAQAAAQTAQDTADTAQAAFVIGRYIGGGTENRVTVTLGFRPKFVIISAHSWDSTPDAKTVHRFGLLTDDDVSGFGDVTDTGFYVTQSVNYPYPYVNVKNIPYRFIAFR